MVETKSIWNMQLGSSIAKHLLLFIYTFGNDNFSINELAWQLEVSESSIRKAIKILKDKELLIITERFSDYGGRLSNSFELNPKNIINIDF